MLCQRRLNRVDAPREHATVPHEVATVDEPLGRRLIRLLGEREDGACGYLIRLVVVRIVLDVAVTRLGMRRLDADSDERAGRLCFGSRDSHDMLERLLILDDVIGGKDEHRRVGIARGQVRSGKGDARSRVARNRLGEDVFGRHVGQLTLRVLGIARVRDD